MACGWQDFCAATKRVACLCARRVTVIATCWYNIIVIEKKQAILLFFSITFSNLRRFLTAHAVELR